MDTEMDELKQKLRLTESKLKDAQGRIQAVELNMREVQRNAKIATDQADALKAETEAAMATAAEQMKLAHTIGCAIFGMTELSRAFMARKITAARAVHRECQHVDRMLQMVALIEKGDLPTLRTMAESVKSTAQTIKTDGEQNRALFQEHYLAQGFTDFETVFDALVKG